MGYYAPQAEEVYNYVFRRGHHAPRRLTDGFGCSILFVNDGSQRCKEFLASYGEELCYLTADRIRFVFFSGLTQEETEEVATRARNHPQGGFLPKIISAVKNSFARRYDWERDAWEDLRPEALFALDSRDHIHRHLKMECENLGAMPGAEEAYRFAQRVGIGRFVPCFLMFSDVMREPAYVWPLGGQSPDRVFQKLRGWINAFYERNRDALSMWSAIEKELEQTISALKTTAWRINSWRDQRAQQWRSLERVSNYQYLLARPEVSRLDILRIAQDDELDWGIRNIARRYTDQLRQIESRIETARALTAETAKLLLTEPSAELRASLMQLKAERHSAIPKAILDKIAAAEQSCNPPAPPSSLPSQLRRWWRQVRQLPKKRHDAFRHCWKEYSLESYRLDDADSLGDVLRAEYRAALNAAMNTKVTSPPEEGADAVVSALAAHLNIKPDAPWEVGTEEYRQFLTLYFSHLRTSAPSWLIERGPLLMADLCWGDCIPTAQLIQECGRGRCLEQMPRLHALINQLPGELEAQKKRPKETWAREVKGSLEAVYSAAVQWQAEGAWIRSDTVSILQALHDALAEKRLEIEKSVVAGHSDTVFSEFSNSAAPEERLRHLVQLLGQYTVAVNALQFPYTRDEEVLRVSIDRQLTQVLPDDAGKLTKSVDAVAKCELMSAAGNAKETLARQSEIEMEALSWSPAGKLFEALSQSLDRQRLEEIYQTSSRSILQKFLRPTDHGEQLRRAAVAEGTREDILRVLKQLDVGELLALEQNLQANKSEPPIGNNAADTKEALYGFVLSAIGLAPVPCTSPSSFAKCEIKPSDGFDVFLAHNSEDRGEVLELGKVLRSHGVYPWIDVQQVPPGRWFQDVLQSAIRQVKSAAILIGKAGLGRWQMVELRTFIGQCVERGIPVIPVLLPGVTSIPDDLLFLRQLNEVRFRDSVGEEEGVAAMVWGITGKKH